MITLDDRQLKAFERDLKTLNEKGLPFATRSTINSAAFDAQKNARTVVQKKMIIRNPFTLKSIQVKKENSLKISEQEALTGSIAKYMEHQEFGVTVTKKGKEGVPIPTTIASGEGEGAQPRKRAVKKAFQLSTIPLMNQSVRAYSKRQAIFLKAIQTVDAGRKFMFLKTQRNRAAIYQLRGGKKKKSGQRTPLKMKMVWDLSRPSVSVPRRPWLKPAVDMTVPKMAGFYKEALLFQLKRLGAK